MKYYAQITGIFCFLTLGVTFWMGQELGLLSFRSLAAADTKGQAGKVTEAKPVEEKMVEEAKPVPETAPKVESSAIKNEAEERHRIEVASNSAAPVSEPTKIEVSSPQSEVLGPIDEREAALETRERLLKDKEAILREQSEHYEKVLTELRQRVGNQSKENKNISAQKEIECSTKLKQREGEYKLQLSKREAELKDKASRKESELRGGLVKKENELKVALQELSTLKDTRAEAFKAMYEKMEPKKAAKIMNEMELDLAHKILGSIKQERASEILGQMNTEKARHITEKAFPTRGTASAK